MKLNFSSPEKKLLYIVIILFMLNFLLSIGYRPIYSLFAKPVAVPRVTVFPEGNTQPPLGYLKPTTYPRLEFKDGLEDFFQFYLPLTIVGLFLIPLFIFSFPIIGSSYFAIHFLPHMILWILALISIPITFRNSKGVPLLKKIIYSYFIASLIAGMGAEIWFAGFD